MNSEGSVSSAGILTEQAYGKLNLTLEVLERRPDGYHDLRMVLCQVSLHDTVRIRLGTGADSCACVYPGSGGANSACMQTGRGQIPEGADNLAMKAARAYADAAELALGGIGIEIIKRIPAQAGMAGGSSDAAAVLRALNRRFAAFSSAELLRLGLQIGSDVPYCLFGGVALAEGRGERLTSLPALPEKACFVLVKPTFSVSTPALFAALDRVRAVARLRADEAYDALAARRITDRMTAALEAASLPDIATALSNDFTEVLSQTQPAVLQLRQLLLQHGALGAELTGTGSVLFGLFNSPVQAEQAAAAIRESTGCFSLASLPLRHG